MEPVPDEMTEMTDEKPDEETDRTTGAATEDAPVAVGHVEPCVAFVGDDEQPGGVCLACGWLVEEHEDLFAFLAPSASAAA